MPTAHICSKLQGLIANCLLNIYNQISNRNLKHGQNRILMSLPKTCSFYALPQIRKGKDHPVSFQVKNPELLSLSQKHIQSVRESYWLNFQYIQNFISSLTAMTISILDQATTISHLDSCNKFLTGFLPLCGLFLSFFFKYKIYCQVGFHTTPSAHPNRCPPQYPSPTLPSLSPPINPQFILSF